MCGVAELPLYRVPVCIVFFKALYQHVSTCIILNIFSAVVKKCSFYARQACCISHLLSPL